MNSTGKENRTRVRAVSPNLGLPSEQRYGEAKVLTGEVKRPVARAVPRKGGFDSQGDLVKNHGGEDVPWA